MSYYPPPPQPPYGYAQPPPIPHQSYPGGPPPQPYTASQPPQYAPQYPNYPPPTPEYGNPQYPYPPAQHHDPYQAYNSGYNPPPSHYAPPPQTTNVYVPPGHAGYNPHYIAPLPTDHQNNHNAPPPPIPHSKPHSPAPPNGVTKYLNVQIPPLGAHSSPSVPGYDPNGDYERIRKATKGFGTDEAALISTLVPRNPMQMSALSSTFLAKSGKPMVEVLDKETTGYFGMTLRGLALGPLWFDVELLDQACRGIGTEEILLTEILVDRTAEDIKLLGAAYQQKFGRSIESVVRGELSAKTQRMYTMILANHRTPDNVPVDRSLVDADVAALYKAGQGKIGTDEIAFCEIIINRSRPHLTAVCDAYQRRYKSLTRVVKSEFSGHMRTTLLHLINGAKPKHVSLGYGVWRDAKLLEAAMKGFGTKDRQLVWRVIRGHWDAHRWQAVKNAYHAKYRKGLEGRVKGETSGDYGKVVTALCR